MFKLLKYAICAAVSFYKSSLKYDLCAERLGKISAQPHTTLCIQFLDRENNE